MPEVLRKPALAAAFAATKRKILEIPDRLLIPGTLLYRYFNPSGEHSPLPMPQAGRPVSRAAANLLLVPGDGTRELGFRFSGLSYNSTIPAAAGFYCVLQQQALVNEAMHSSRKVGVWALSGRAVMKMRLIAPILVADLSPHHPRGRRFLRELGSETWTEMNDPKDCSVARGIGLAIAQSPNLHGLVAQTVRESERSEEERGDNVVLFAAPGQAIRGLSIEEISYYGKRYNPEVFSVS